MKKQEYFKEIAEKVAEKRNKSTWSKEEQNAYARGKEEAFKEVLHFLHPKKSDIYYTRQFSKDELWKFVQLNLSEMQSRLKKARQIYVQQSKIIRDLSQLQID
jgi:hypothetical protein